MLGSIVVAALFPAAAAALVISLIPPRILGITGKALSLVATGLLLTLSLTHLLPEAIEEGSDIHDIGLTILVTILVLVAIEMFFNSNHHSQTCPVCAANEQTKTYAKEHNFHPNDKADTNAKDKSQANSMITSIVKPLNAANDTLSKSAAFDAAHKASCSDPNCSCHHEHEHDHDHQHAPASVCSCGQVHTIDPEHPDKRSTLHHLGHSHGFDLRGRDFVDATRRADENAALGKGSIKEGLSNGGAPILAGSLFHSICDGIVLASSFMVDFNVGVAVTAAIIAHEMPQQLSNYLLMLNFGMSRKQGFIVNLTAMLGSLIGAIVFYNILDKAENILPFALAVAGGSFIYVALSDILPRINRPDNKRMMAISYSYLVIGAAIAMMLSHHH